MAISTIQDEMLEDNQGVCKAWVNFDGTGTVAIRDSFNVTSITDNATADYTVNFTNALANADYTACLSVGDTGSTTGQSSRGIAPRDYAVGSLRFHVMTGTGSAIDYTNLNVAIFGD